MSFKTNIYSENQRSSENPPPYTPTDLSSHSHTEASLDTTPQPPHTYESTSDYIDTNTTYSHSYSSNTQVSSNTPSRSPTIHESVPSAHSSTSPPDYNEAIRDKGKASTQAYYFQNPLSNFVNAANTLTRSRSGPNAQPPLTALTNTAGRVAMNLVQDVFADRLDRGSGCERRRTARRTQREQDRMMLSEQFEGVSGIIKSALFIQSPVVGKQFESRLALEQNGSAIGSSRSASEQYPSASSSSRPSLEQSKSSSSHNRRFEIKQRDGPLTFEEDWSGDECYLKTSNGPLTLRGTLRARHQVQIESRNGMITIERPLFSPGSVNIKSTNGGINLHGSVQVALLNISMKNAPISIDSHLESNQTNISTKNAPIILTQVIAHKKLTVKTTNSPIVLHVLELHRDTEIHVESSNSPVTVYLPRTFSGRFSVSSSATSSASVSAQTLDSHLVFEKEEGHKKQGRCMNMGNKSNAHITIKTTNAPSLLYI